MRKCLALIAFVLFVSVADASGCAVVRSQLVVQSAPVIAVQSFAQPVFASVAVQQVAVQPVVVQSLAVQSFAAVVQPVCFQSVAVIHGCNAQVRAVRNVAVRQSSRTVIRQSIRSR